MKGRHGDFLHENLNAQKFGSVKDVERMKLLCDCRNKCKKLLEPTQAKHTLMLDSDIKFNKSNLIYFILLLIYLILFNYFSGIKIYFG